MGGLAYGNKSKFITKQKHTGDLTLKQNVNMYFSPDVGLTSYVNADFSLNTKTGFGFNFNELYIAWETNDKGNYYFGRRNRQSTVAQIFPLCNVLNNNYAAVEAELTNNKWITFNGGFYYDFAGNPDIKNFNLMLITNMYNDFISYTVATYELHLLDIPEGSFENLFHPNIFKQNLETYQNNIEFVTAQTVTLNLGSCALYGELFVRTNPLKYKVSNNELVFAGKKGYFDGTLGFAYGNDILDLAFEYCYAMSGYDHNEIAAINTLLEQNNTELDKIRAKGPIFFKNNIGLSLAFNIGENLVLGVGDKVTFPQYGCDPSYIGTSFYVKGNYTYNDNLSFDCIIEGAAGGKNSEFTLYNKNIASLKFGAKLSY